MKDNQWSPEEQVDILFQIMEDYPVKFDPFYDYLLAITDKLPIGFKQDDSNQKSD